MQKKVGRPPEGGPGKLLQMRLKEDDLARLDDWRRNQPDVPTRTEAIRRLLDTHPDLIQALTEVALKAEGKKGGK